MRILSFSQEWPKLKQPKFTTFRYPRRDRDWDIGEWVQVVLNPISLERKKLGIAKIVGKEYRELSNFFKLYCPATTAAKIPVITQAEAQADGFTDRTEMIAYVEKQYGPNYISLFNKLTLEWQ